MMASHGGPASISSRLWRSRCDLARAPPSTHAEYHRPDCHMRCSWGRAQCRLRAGFSRTSSCSISPKTHAQAWLSTETRFKSLPRRPGRPSGYCSERSETQQVASAGVVHGHARLLAQLAAVLPVAKNTKLRAGELETGTKRWCHPAKGVGAQGIGVLQVRVELSPQNQATPMAVRPVRSKGPRFVGPPVEEPSMPRGTPQPRGSR